MNPQGNHSRAKASIPPALLLLAAVGALWLLLAGCASAPAFTYQDITLGDLSETDQTTVLTEIHGGRIGQMQARFYQGEPNAVLLTFSNRAGEERRVIFFLQRKVTNDAYMISNWADNTDGRYDNQK